MNKTNTARRMVLAAGLAVVLAMGAGCAAPGNYWYEKRCWDVEPNLRTLENGPYHLVCRGHANLILWAPDTEPCITDEIRGKVSQWLEMPPEEVDMAHVAWWLHRKSVANYGKDYSVAYPDTFSEKCVVSSHPFTDIQRQLFNWIKWRRESLYEGEKRKELRFAYFGVVRGLETTEDIEFWVCIFDKEGNPLSTASSLALKPERVAALQVPGSRRGELVDVRWKDGSLTMWNPNEYQESDSAVVRGLLVEALNAMDEEDFARLDYED